MGIFIQRDQEERFWAAALGAGSRVGRLLLNSHSGPLCPWLPPLLAPSWADQPYRKASWSSSSTQFYWQGHLALGQGAISHFRVCPLLLQSLKAVSPMGSTHPSAVSHVNLVRPQHHYYRLIATAVETLTYYREHQTPSTGWHSF